MQRRVVRCTNCGKVSPQEHILPLCNNCFAGLEDYEEFLVKMTGAAEIAIEKKPVRPDNFLQL